MNIEQARINMIKQQVRAWGVSDERVLELLQRTPREAFVPEAYRALACADIAIPLGHGQIMMTPKEEGRLLQAVQVKPTDRVLEIGTGSGYLTALLAKQAQRVVSVEIIPALAEQARKALATQGIHHVECITGDASRGWPAEAPYDVIVATGSYPLMPEVLKNMLTIGGRLFVVVGEAPAMEAKLITRVSETSWCEQTLFETVLPAIDHAPRKAAFQL